MMWGEIYMGSMITAFTTGLSGVETSAMSLITTILPIGIAITAAVWLAKKGLRWFRGLAG